MEKPSYSRIAIVTGGNSGIGAAIVEKLNEEGITVVVADLQGKPKSENVFYRKCDVTKGQEVDDLYTWVQENIGKPDILILNAGRGLQEKLIEGDPEKWQEIINTNLMGPLRCIRSFVPAMMEEKKGNVVIISSVSANQPHEFGGIYTASKTALEVIAETLRLETLPYIKVTVVCPGIVDTAFFKNQLSGGSSIEEMDQGSIAPEEIAEDIWYALNRKSGTSINKIVTRPVKQAF